MPIRQFIEQYQHDPESFDFDAFKKAALEEFDQDETAWRAAVTTRDDTITKTAADLQRAQSKAWELSQSQAVTTSDGDDEPDPDSLDEIRNRVFTTIKKE